MNVVSAASEVMDHKQDDSAEHKGNTPTEAKQNEDKENNQTEETEGQKTKKKTTHIQNFTFICHQSDMRKGTKENVASGPVYQSHKTTERPKKTPKERKEQKRNIGMCAAMLPTAKRQNAQRHQPKNVSNVSPVNATMGGSSKQLATPDSMSQDQKVVDGVTRGPSANKQIVSKFRSKRGEECDSQDSKRSLARRGTYVLEPNQLNSKQSSTLER